MNKEIIEIVINTLIILIGIFWLKNYLPSYFNEKGKLLAQKEDISEITKKIESIKIDFTKETEYLKNELQRILSLELTHRNEERNVIIEYFTESNQWLYALLEIFFGGYHRGNIDDLRDKRIYINQFYAKTNVSQSKLILLVKNEDINNLSYELMKSILKFKGWIDGYLLRLQHNLERHNSLTNQFLEVIKNLEGNEEVAKNLAKEEQQIEQEYKDIIKEFYDNRNKECESIFVINKQFTDLVKSYLTK